MAENWRTQLASAPKKQSDAATGSEASGKSKGTQMTVRAYDVFSGMSRNLLGRDYVPDFLKPVFPDHMYVEYDDGDQQYIYRGGPSPHGLHVEVTPARTSKDIGRGERVLDQAFLPGVSARSAVAPAIATAKRIETERPPYLGAVVNSNWAVGELTDRQVGRRVGDDQTWGWGDDLGPQARSAVGALVEDGVRSLLTPGLHQMPALMTRRVLSRLGEQQRERR